MLEFSGYLFLFFQAEDGIRDADVTGVQTCALPISKNSAPSPCKFRFEYCAISRKSNCGSLGGPAWLIALKYSSSGGRTVISAWLRAPTSARTPRRLMKNTASVSNAANE